MKTKTKVLLAVAVIVVTISALMISGIANFSGQQVTITAIATSVDEFEGKYLRVEGDLLEETINWNGEKVELTFQATDGENILDVSYNGAQPDNFYEGVEVILEGYYHGDGQFVAETVQTRCPSTYEEPTPDESNNNS